MSLVGIPVSGKYAISISARYTWCLLYTAGASAGAGACRALQLYDLVQLYGQSQWNIPSVLHL